jgi:hypothetical protein
VLNGTTHQEVQQPTLFDMGFKWKSKMNDYCLQEFEEHQVVFLASLALFDIIDTVFHRELGEGEWG